MLTVLGLCIFFQSALLNRPASMGDMTRFDGQVTGGGHTPPDVIPDRLLRPLRTALFPADVARMLAFAASIVET